MQIAATRRTPRPPAPPRAAEEEADGRSNGGAISSADGGATAVPVAARSVVAGTMRSGVCVSARSVPCTAAFTVVLHGRKSSQRSADNGEDDVATAAAGLAVARIVEDEEGPEARPLPASRTSDSIASSHFITRCWRSGKLQMRAPCHSEKHGPGSSATISAARITAW